MLGLQAGAHNINFVSPTHVVLPILRALRIALAEGLEVPLVWNSNGYDGLEVVRDLEGIVDVFLPDLSTFRRTSPKDTRRAGLFRPGLRRPSRRCPSSSPRSTWAPAGRPERGSSSGISSSPARSKTRSSSLSGSASTALLSSG